MVENETKASEPASADNGADQLQRLEGHVVICGWNSKGPAIIQGLRSEVINSHEQPLIVIITDKQLPKRIGKHWRGVFTVDGSPLEKEHLLQARIEAASSAIILADEESANPDAANFMLAASIEKISEGRVHTIVEIADSAYLSHFEGTGVDEMICVSEIAEKIISQACLTHGLSDLYLDLLTASQDTNEIYFVDAPPSTHGKTYRDVRRAVGMYDKESLVLLGFLSQVNGDVPAPDYNVFKRKGKQMIMVVNPTKNGEVGQQGFTQDYIIKPGDELIFMAYLPPRLNGFFVDVNQ